MTTTIKIIHVLQSSAQICITSTHSTGWQWYDATYSKHIFAYKLFVWSFYTFIRHSMILRRVEKKNCTGKENPSTKRVPLYEREKLWSNGKAPHWWLLVWTHMPASVIHSDKLEFRPLPFTLSIQNFSFSECLYQIWLMRI